MVSRSKYFDTFPLHLSSQTRLSLVTKNKLPRHRPGQNASVCSAIPHSLSGAMHSLWCHLDCPMRPGLCNASWTVKCQHAPSTESAPRALLWLRQKASLLRTTALSTDNGLLYSPIRPQAPIIALALFCPGSSALAPCHGLFPAALDSGCSRSALPGFPRSSLRWRQGTHPRR